MKLQIRFVLSLIITFAILTVVGGLIGRRYVPEDRVPEATVLYALAALVSLAAVLLAFILVMGDTRKSIQELAKATDRIASGDLSHRVGTAREDELGKLAVSFNGMAEYLQEQRHQLELNQQRLEAVNTELRTINHNYMEMLGFVAHELKNPLTSAIMGLHTVKDGYLGPVNPAQGKSLETAAVSLAYFQDMIRDYLDLSRLEKGEITIQKTYFPLHQRVIEPVLEGLERELQARRMVIEDRIPAGKVVYADANLLRIVYNNLLSNAAKYGVEGGTIVLDLQENGTATVLSVRNDSQGIPPEQLSLLFGKFSRLDDPEYAVKRGTGLGLYICKQIVESHGGKISADSKLGEWVEFRFTLRNGDV